MADFQPLPDLPDGIYFGLPEDIYHALPRMGSSGLCAMLISPATFWASSWLNPEENAAKAARAKAALGLMDFAPASPLGQYEQVLLAAYPDDHGAQDEESTKAQLLGKAYHCARLEPERLESSFARQPSKDEWAATAKREKRAFLTNSTEIGEALAVLGAAKKKAGESVVEQAQRLRGKGYDGYIWPEIVAEFDKTLGKRIPIPADLWDQMMRDVERIRQSPEIADKLQGGQAEVSVLYTGRGGIPRKVRFDYLTALWWVDFKTFSNKVGKNLNQVLTEAFRYNRHYVQAVAYREAAELLRANALAIIGEATDEQRELIARLAIAPEELECWYVYQETGSAPNILARSCRFYDVPQATRLHHIGATPEQQQAAEDATRTEMLWHYRAKAEIGKALRDFELHSEIYQPGRPWLPINALGEFSDDDFPAFWLDERI